MWIVNEIRVCDHLTVSSEKRVPHLSLAAGWLQEKTWCSEQGSRGRLLWQRIRCQGCEAGAVVMFRGDGLGCGRG